MKLFISLLCFFTFISCSIGASENFSEKLIISASTNLQKEEEMLLKLKIYFTENLILGHLEKKHHLKMNIEAVDNYYVVVITPLYSLNLRNQLLLELASTFPDSLFVNNSIVKKSSTLKVNKQIDIPTTRVNINKSEKFELFDALRLQWVAIWLFAVIGLFLSIWNRRKLSKLTETQEGIRVDQYEIEKEITTLGAQNV